VKVQKSGSGQHLVNLPESLRKAMGIEKGDEVEWEVEDENTLKLKLNC
jgi:antitoxin component of MazEF toxin-antitoxin module